MKTISLRGVVALGAGLVFGMGSMSAEPHPTETTYQSFNSMAAMSANNNTAITVTGVSSNHAMASFSGWPYQEIAIPSIPMSRFLVKSYSPNAASIR